MNFRGLSLLSLGKLQFDSTWDEAMVDGFRRTFITGFRMNQTFLTWCILYLECQKTAWKISCRQQSAWIVSLPNLEFKMFEFDVLCSFHVMKMYKLFLLLLKRKTTNFSSLVEFVNYIVFLLLMCFKWCIGFFMS